jgi:hypothetical protein
MSVLTIEGIVENGQIRLRENLTLPDQTKVFVVVPDQSPRPAHIVSPRLARREQVADFAKQVIEVPDDA